MRIIATVLLLLCTLHFLSAEKPEIGKEILISGGDYYVGYEKEKDNKPLRLKRFSAFYMDAHPVTNAQFLSFLKQSGYTTEGSFNRRFEASKAQYPATNVTFKDASAYARYYKKRLPTEWEWEIAARSLEGERIYIGNGAGDPLRGNLYHHKKPHITSVFRYAPNRLGFYDMAGNVYEWTASRYPKKMLYGAYKDRFEFIVLRGGAWTSNSNDVRVTTRTPFPKLRSLGWIGFRCVRDADAAPNAY